MFMFRQIMITYELLKFIKIDYSRGWLIMNTIFFWLRIEFHINMLG